MTNRLTKLVAAACYVAGLWGFELSAWAQGAGTQPRPGVPIDQPQIDASQDITATGCLAKDGDNYLLRNAAVLIRPWMAPGLRPDALGAPKPTPSKTVFRLMNRDGLEAHVGHLVEVTGVIQPQTANLPPSPDTIVTRGNGPRTASAPGTAAAPGTAGAQGTAEQSRFVPRLNNPELDNKPLKMISATCS